MSPFSPPKTVAVRSPLFHHPRFCTRCKTQFGKTFPPHVATTFLQLLFRYFCCTSRAVLTSLSSQKSTKFFRTNCCPKTAAVSERFKWCTLDIWLKLQQLSNVFHCEEEKRSPWSIYLPVDHLFAQLRLQSDFHMIHHLSDTPWIRRAVLVQRTEQMFV